MGTNLTKRGWEIIFGVFVRSLLLKTVFKRFGGGDEDIERRY